MMPDYPLEETLDFKFTTRSFSTGVPSTLAGTPGVEIYEDNSLIQITAAETLTADFDSITGLNNLRVVATAANGFEAGKSYAAVLSAGTVDGTSVVGEVVAQWSMERSPVNWANVTAPTTAVDLSATDIQLADTTTTLTNLPAITANWLTATGINANAITSAKIATDAIGAAQIAANAIGASELATDAIGDAQVATGAIASTAFAAGAIDAAAIANSSIDAATFVAGAIDASALAADAVTEIRSLVSGTADAGGTTTTLVDAALTEIDDTWIGSWLLLTSGTDANRCRLITEFAAATDTITFAPAVSAAVGAGVTYEILPGAGVDVQSWLGTEAALAAPNALVAGAVDADVSAIQANAITAASIATDAIGAAELAADAATEIRDAVTGGAYALDTDANGRIRIVDGTGVGELDTVSGLVQVSFAQTLPGSPTADTVGDALKQATREEGPKKNTAFNDLSFLMVDTTDHVTPETGLTPSGTRSLDGGAFAAVTGTISEVANGMYVLDASAADMNADMIIFRFTDAAADDTFITVKTVA